MVSVTPLFSQIWQQHAPTGNIPGKANASAIYHQNQNDIIIFGGKTSAGFTNDIWALNLDSMHWREIIPQSTVNPSVRHTQNAMYDSLRNRMIIWGGQGSGLFNDIWAFDFNDTSWYNLSANGNVSGIPLQRYGTSSVYDPQTDNVISFAGFTTSGRFDDTWKFNIGSNTWTDETNATFPLKRCLYSGCFVPSQRKMIIYGGQNNGNLDDIWQLNIDNFTWTDITPVNKPPARHFPSLVYDGGNNLLLFGGNGLNQNNFSGALNDLWNFSLSTQTWDTLSQGSIKPSARIGHTAIYVQSNQKMIVFGGNEASGLFNNEVWEYSVGNVTSVLETKNKEFFDVNISPNPVKNQVNLSFELYKEQKIVIRILNLLGEQVLPPFNDNKLPKGLHTKKIDLRALLQGVYIISIQKGLDKPYLEKIIKQ
ncbi:MAG: T9SS type A sorting domain-containing protein [Flavobacteriales bacterium]|nr:T9SS type A sorting domain-containing protein [Flavobacteriales bacterium]